MTNRREVLPDRMNHAPAIFKGCTSGELGALVGLAILIWLPLSLLIAAALGAVTMGFGLAGLGIVGTVVLGAQTLQSLKRNRPDGFTHQRVVLWLHRKHLRRAPLIVHSGVWDLGRHLYAPHTPRA